jgi:hypothetical protein
MNYTGESLDSFALTIPHSALLSYQHPVHTRDVLLPESILPLLYTFSRLLLLVSSRFHLRISSINDTIPLPFYALLLEPI